MKGIHNNHHNYFMEAVLGGKETLDAACEQIGDDVFERYLNNEPLFEEIVDALWPSAIAVGFRRSARDQGLKGITWDNALAKIGTIKRQDPDFANAMRALVTQDLQQAIAFEVAGQQTYRFAVPLSERLMHTSIDIPASLFNLPHKCFQTVHSSREAIDVFCRALEVLQPRLSVTPNSAYGGSVSITVSLVETGMNGSKELLLNYMLFFPPGGRNTSRSLKTTLPIDPEVDDRLPDIISSRTVSIPDHYTSPDTSDRGEFDDRVTALLRLAANSALYLVSTNADIGAELDPYSDLKRKSVAEGLPAKQRKRAARDLLTTSKTKFRDVGKNFESVKFGTGGAGSSETESSARKLAKRIVVSGHYKVQRFGPGRSESKIIFVEPYIKGPEAADIVSGNYYVPDMRRNIVDDDHAKDLGG